MLPFLLGGLLGGGAAAGAATSAALGLAGTLASGAFQSRAQRKANKANSIQGRVRDAEAAGINPLVALNANLPAQQPVTGFGNAIEQAFKLADPQVRRERQLREQVTQAETENLKLQNLILKRRLQPQRGGIYAQTAQKSNRAVHNSRSTGVRSGKVLAAGEPTYLTAKNGEIGSNDFPKEEIYPLYVTVYDQQTGRRTRVMNPDLMDTSPQEAAYSAAAIGAADLAQNGLGQGTSVQERNRRRESPLPHPASKLRSKFKTPSRNSHTKQARPALQTTLKIKPKTPRKRTSDAYRYVAPALPYPTAGKPRPF